MVRASAADVQKQFGLYSEKAQREAVTITKHGRDSVVMLSAETFKRMSEAYYAAKSYYAWELPADIVAAVEDELDRLEADAKTADAAK